MTFSARYDFWSGHLDWLDPAPSSLDSEIGEFCARFLSAPMPERIALIASLSANDSYTLQDFAERAAILGLRAGDARRIEDGLVAAGAIGADAMDPRDVDRPLPLLLYCLDRVGADAAQAFRDASRRTPGRMAGVLDGPLLARWEARDSFEDWRRADALFLEVSTVAGIGFVHRGTRPYAPRADLVAAALDFVPFLRAEPGLQFDCVSAREDLPVYWLTGRPGASLLQDELGVLGVCHIRAKRRPTPSAGSHGWGPLLWVSLVETGEPAGAVRLAEIANEARHERASLLGVARGTLGAVVLVYAQSAAELDESPSSLERFRDPLRTALAGRLE